MAEIKCELKVIQCPLIGTECCTPSDYAMALVDILDGTVDPKEFELEHIIEEVKSWT